MTITLPYHFDTTTSFRTVVKGGTALGMLVIAGMAHSLLISHDYIVVLQLAFVGAMVFGMTCLFLALAHGSIGMLTTREVIVEQAPALFGLRFPGPSGRFALDRFSAVRLEEASGPVRPSVNAGPHSRIYLVGKTGSPDVLIARTTSTGGTEAEQFAAALGLPLQRVATYH